MAMHAQIIIWAYPRQYGVALKSTDIFILIFSWIVFITSTIGLQDMSENSTEKECLGECVACWSQWGEEW